MPRTMLPGGAWKEITLDELRERSGEDAVRDLTDPIKDPADYSPLEQRMHSQARLSAELRTAGIQSLDDLPVEGDDETISLDDLVPKAYDAEGADRDFRELVAREGADKSSEG